MKLYRAIPIVLMLLSPALLFASDPFLGKWILDTKASQYPLGVCPKQMTIEMTATGHGVHYHSNTQMLNGNTFTADYTADYDEKPVVVAGAKGVLLPVSLKREDSNVVIASYISGLQVRATSRRVVSKDGRVMTVTTTSQDGAGNTMTNVGLYHKIAATLSGNVDLSRGGEQLLHLFVE